MFNPGGGGGGRVVADIELQHSQIHTILRVSERKESKCRVDVLQRKYRMDKTS